MDFFSRLLGGSRISPTKPGNPQQRLQRFRRHFEQIRGTYERDPLLQTDSIAAESIRSNLQRLTTILQDESRSPQPHPCLSFVDSGNIYQTVGRIGALAQNEAVIREAVAFFSALVDADEDDFLSNRRFAHALMMFVDRTSGSGNLFVGDETEGEIVELLFGIAAKIRLEPELLATWFKPGARPRIQPSEEGKKNAFVGVTSKEDFPLCYHLIDHVHHEGRIGDFARTGLLYVFETASKSQELEQWIIESDLPTLMASGLGALYSQLSRKLSIIHPKSELPVILQLSDYLQLEPPPEAESIFSDHLQGHLATFLSYLTFWQDVLEHCTSRDVSQTLLDHFQILFLQQLLYPSLLESSDVDGGSSVAVLTYIRQILIALDHPEFIHLILQYLLALPQGIGMESSVVSLSQYAVNKRKSLLLMVKTSNDDEEANPELFNLTDLVHSSIRSANPQTAVSALKLMTILLHKDHQYANGSIIKTEPPYLHTTKRTHGALNAEMQAYLSVAEDIGGEAGMDEAYETHLKDSQRHIELHCCSAPLLNLERLGIPLSPNPLAARSAAPPSNVPVHTLQHGDRFFSHLLRLLRNFLTNNVELNLSLTEVIVTLASCPQLRLEDWLAVSPHSYRFSEQEAVPVGDDVAFSRLQQARCEPTWNDQHSPLLLKTFQSIETQIQTLKSEFPSFSQLVNTRKQAFRLHDEITEAMINTPPRITIGAARGTTSSPTPNRATGSGLTSRLFSRTESPSRRSSSPRGRTAIRPDLSSGPTSSPSPNQRAGSLFSSPAPGSPAQRPMSGEPARPVVVGHTPENLLSDIIEGANSELLVRKIKFPLTAVIAKHNGSNGDADTEDGRVRHNYNNEDGESKEVSLSHVLTNIVILQEFILELVAVMQVRASLLGEVAFA